MDRERLQRAYENARGRLLQARTPDGHWVGCLATSALSTATAVSALSLVRRHRLGPGEAVSPSSHPSRNPSRIPSGGERGQGPEDTKAGTTSDVPPDAIVADESLAELERLIQGGIDWLIRHQNPDGGWGDTDRSHSNIATTMLCQAAIHLAEKGECHADALARAEHYVAGKNGVHGLRERYGKDKTFAVPILANGALAGLVPWKDVSPLPFELACLPQSWYRFAQLPVVSYAIPALVAIGQARFLQAPPWFEPLRWLRRAAMAPSLRVLRRIQPESGGYLEAIPLTSFVVMSLAGTGRADHEVARAGVDFLRSSVRDDGSWPIDTNLATWNTSLALRALSVGGEDVGRLDCWPWLLECQNRSVHPFTGAEPGGWGWSDLSGSVPDADDTPAALLALHAWRQSPSYPESSTPRLMNAVGNGLRWLMHLQNRDGGWPTFCRGWGKLPFDRSGSDLTAHALRAWRAWQPEIAAGHFSEKGIFESSGRLAVERGFRYLESTQLPSGAWLPLWFGNQDHPDELNPVYGTAKVLLAFLEYGRWTNGAVERGLHWLMEAQNPDGGWGAGKENGEPISSSSIEETSLALETLGVARQHLPNSDLAPLLAPLEPVWEHGLNWLVERTEAGEIERASPIGFYFAKLWYYEALYPLTFGLAALGQAYRTTLAPPPPISPSQPPTPQSSTR